MPTKTTWVIVLGDFGRSPRMQFHALSLAEQVQTCHLPHTYRQLYSEQTDDLIAG